MEFRKTSRVVLASLIVVGACFSTPAMARHEGRVVRDILLAPLLLPAAIVAASAPRPVVYQETYYAEPRYRVERYEYAPRRHDARRYEGYRDHGGYGGHGGHGGHYRHYR